MRGTDIGSDTRQQTVSVPVEVVSARPTNSLVDDTPSAQSSEIPQRSSDRGENAEGTDANSSHAVPLD